MIYLCGEYNGRIGIVHEIDSLPERKPLDKTVHGHGESLFELMQDAKLCVLNGPLNPENDNYTCISPCRSSVVDYIITPHDVYYKCQAFHFYTTTDMIYACNLAPLIGDRCKPPDHFILHVNFNTIEVFNQESNVNDTFDIESGITEENRYKKRKYRFNNVPHFFMSSAIWTEGMAQLIELFLNCRKQQDDIDMCYETFCYSFTSEMDQYLKYSDSSKKVRKMYKNHKPYWSQELADL